MLRIKEMRKQRGMNQMELAKLVGVAQGYVSDLENERYSPSLGVLIRLAKALDCTLDELVDLESAFKAS